MGAAYLRTQCHLLCSGKTLQPLHRQSLGCWGRDGLSDDQRLLSGDQRLLRHQTSGCWGRIQAATSRGREAKRRLCRRYGSTRDWTQWHLLCSGKTLQPLQIMLATCWGRESERRLGRRCPTRQGPAWDWTQRHRLCSQQRCNQRLLYHQTSGCWGCEKRWG